MINSKELLQYTQNLTLLFVEDHQELRINTTEILKNFFKTVDSFDNGADALEAYKSQYLLKPYDIVLTDIQMPKMNGVELTENIYDVNVNQTVIVLSAHDEAQYLLPLINLGIEYFLKKPIDYQELLKVLLDTSKKLAFIEDIEHESTLIYLSENVIFNKESKTLLSHSENIYLTKYELIFIELLVKEDSKIYSNEDIVTHFLSLQEEIDPQNIRKLVSKLRKKLPVDSLESIYGVGYRIIPYRMN